MAVVTITTENFAQEVLHSDKPVLLDFWASWCGPCRMLSPIVDEVAEERTDVKVGKVNVDEQPDLAAQFGVMSIPTRGCPPQGRCAGAAGLRCADRAIRRRLRVAFFVFARRQLLRPGGETFSPFCTNAPKKCKMELQTLSLSCFTTLPR